MISNHPIKDHLFKFVNNSQEIHKLVSEQRLDLVVYSILDNCFDDIIKMDKYDTAVAIMATSILHYILTVALIPSQRKIKHKGIELDIVIPNAQVLSQDPMHSIVICIPQSSDINIIKSRILEIESINPMPHNIWVVLSNTADIKERSFILERDGRSFVNCIMEIAKFYNTQGSSKLKILRI